MLNLNNIDLICIDCIDIERAEKAINYSQQKIKYNSCKLLSNIECSSEYCKYIQIPQINNLIEYSNFVIKNLVHYINADYVLIIQHDGYVLNPTAWTKEFLEYDYIGAPWYWSNYLVGNGGFSLRSRKLLEFLSNTIHGQIEVAEDWFICSVIRNILIKKGFKFADLNLAMQFSTETYPPYTNQFGWHGKRNP
jgi:hypothetical protein